MCAKHWTMSCRHQCVKAMVHIYSVNGDVFQQPSWLPWCTGVAFSLGVLIALVELVRRAERAAERAEAAARRINPEFAVPGRDTDSTVMRAAARWGADVLSAVASGSSGVDAVRRAVPRIGGRLHGVPEDRTDAGSEVSTDELPQHVQADPNDWVARASQSVTPVPDLQRQLYEADARAAWQAAGAGTSGGVFISGLHGTHSAMFQRPTAIASRPSHSPTHD